MENLEVEELQLQISKKRNQESLFIQAMHHVHSQESAETLRICKHFVL